MIPLKIELTNFLSYRQHTILDYHGIHLACISGANGAGKSSLLDAMTWSLFGQSRSRSDDDLVNKIASTRDEAAEVRFSFELEGVAYQVIRRKRVGKPLVLEFQIATIDGQWKTLSEGKVRETQVAIENLLNMNYDTFTNASFLLQGKADEFTTKTPNQRKEILADLLGVTEWDTYRDRAADRRKYEEGRLQLTNARLEDIDLELAKRSEREAALQNASETLAQISKQLTLLEEQLDSTRRTKAAIDQQEQAIHRLKLSLTQAQKNLESLQQTHSLRQRERDDYQALLDDAQTIEHNFAAWQRADHALTFWQTKSEAYNGLLQKKRPFELEIERERTRLQQRESELKQLRQRVETMQAERVTHEDSRQKITIQLAANEQKILQLEASEQTWLARRDKLAEVESGRALLKQEAAKLGERQESINQLKKEKESVIQNIGAADSAVDAAERELTVLLAHNERLMAAKTELDSRQKRQPDLKKQMADKKETIDRLMVETGGQCPLCGQKLSPEHRETVLEQLKSEGREMGDEYRENSTRIESLTAEVSALQAKLKRREQLEREQRSQQQRHAAAEARLQEIDRALVTWADGEASRLAELQNALADDAELVKLKSQVTALQQEISEKSNLESERQRLQRELVRTDAKLEEIERAVALWQGESPGEGQQVELASVITRLESEDYAHEAQQAIKTLNQDIAEINYDPGAHKLAREERTNLAEANDKYQLLQQARAAVAALDNSLGDLVRQLDTQKHTIADLTTQYTEANQQYEILTANQPDLDALEKEVYRRREEQIAAHRRVATAQQSVSVLDDLAEQRQTVGAERDEINHLIQRLKLLEKACGREGVQALLIERAMPEIEDTANEILDRLTGGQMQVLFESRRKLKSIDRLAETLDIHITDSSGERPYENYSGGEQFRVNFAIRLALSKLLTKRAGARLQTLVIDEGFGSQDPQGRQRLIEAINTIQNDFERILVITHIEELRDAFPTRIEVEKGAGGSVITVSEV